LLFYIFNYQVAMLSSKKEGYSILIDSPEFSTAFQSFFNFLWEISKNFIIDKKY